MSAATGHLDSQPKLYDRHKEYFLPGGDLYLLVDNMIFRIHAYFFERDSAKFRAKLNAHIPPNQTRPGSSESTPILIKNTSPSEFARFLWIFYNKKYSDYSSASTQDWIVILKIACENDFVEVQHCAIRGLQACDLTTVEKIAIYELYRADKKYIVPLYVEMAKRDQSPSTAEENRLGDKTTLSIFRLRERLRSHAIPTFSDISPLPVGIDDNEALRLVCGFLHVDPARVPLPGARIRPSRPRRTPSSTETTSQNSYSQDRRDARVFDDMILSLGGGQHSEPVTKENAIAYQKVPGEFEIGKKDVDDCSPGFGLISPQLDDNDSCEIRAVDLDPYARSTQARVNLIYFAASWTIVVFWGIKTIPYNIQIL